LDTRAYDPHPLLVLVAGAPAAGKTTLAGTLAAKLRLPLLSRDPITHALADALNPGSWEAMQAVTPISFQVFFGLLDHYLAAGGGVVCETNFHQGVAEADLLPRVQQATAVLIHCQTARSVSEDRFTKRFERGERHWSTFDGERLASIRAGEPQAAWDNATPLKLGIPTLLVDTTDGYAPDIPSILAFVRAVSLSSR
jgi:predicted kinase